MMGFAELNPSYRLPGEESESVEVVQTVKAVEVVKSVKIVEIVQLNTPQLNALCCPCVDSTG
jgi:hypothetical protein